MQLAASGKAVDLRGIAVLVVLWVAAVLAVGPAGDFPVVDDWAYAYSVKALLAGEGVRFSDWNAANLLSQVFWGAGFAAVLGMGYTALRVSTLVAGLIGAVALYRLFRLAGVSPGLALLGTLAGVFNPLYFNLAFSFMTDTPYAAAQLAAMWLLAGGLLSGSRVVQGLGWAVGVAALLCRQLGLFIPAGIAGEAALRRPWSWRRVLAAGAGVAAFVAIQWGFQQWLQATGRAPAFYGRQITGIGDGFRSHPVMTLVGMAVLVRDSFFYLGLFALPLSLACARAWRDMLPDALRRWAWPAAAGATALVCAVAWWRGWTFPVWANTINLHSGLGVERTGTPVPDWVAGGLTVVSSLGGVLLAAALAGALARWWRGPRGEGFDVAAFAAITGLCAFGSVALVAMRFDRYLIPVTPCVLLALAPLLRGYGPDRPALAAGWAALAAMALASVGATHDFMAAKRAQWTAYQELVRTVRPTHVDAGWVINGAMSYHLAWNRRPIEDWYDRADYLVGVDLPPGYVVVSEHPVSRWSPWNQGGRPILVARRAP